MIYLSVQRRKHDYNERHSSVVRDYLVISNQQGVITNSQVPIQMLHRQEKIITDAISVMRFGGKTGCTTNIQNVSTSDNLTGN